MSPKLLFPPIFYAVAVIKFNPVLNMGDYIVPIQTDMRKKYPDFQKGVSSEIQIQVNGQNAPTVKSNPAELWEFRNTSLTSGFSLTQNHLRFQTTAYEDSDTFVKAILEGFETIHKHVGLAYTEIAAVRLLDAVIPKDGEDLTTYLTPGPLGLRNILDGEITQGVCQAVFKTPAGLATSRTILVRGALGFPQDLLPLNLKLNTRLKSNTLHAVIDNDCQYQSRISPIDTVEIEKRIRAAKAQATKAFKNALTPAALDIWNGIGAKHGSTTRH
ncbi:TIGR04255 family protein [Terriglobus roseus]|uniref:TIGR04255 family protein n=1 Tax=Terriglobus roseus TaxID=392734 RepID=A0A1H4NU45_9BACT|nr:TIGR04255 family protein [Terriglobus roseus]SEB98726.1 TIGR04255 family protein [Terriglobus roseus]